MQAPVRNHLTGAIALVSDEFSVPVPHRVALALIIRARAECDCEERAVSPSTLAPATATCDAMPPLETAERHASVLRRARRVRDANSDRGPGAGAAVERRACALRYIRGEQARTQVGRSRCRAAEEQPVWRQQRRASGRPSSTGWVAVRDLVRLCIKYPKRPLARESALNLDDRGDARELRHLGRHRVVKPEDL